MSIDIQPLVDYKESIEKLNEQFDTVFIEALYEIANRHLRMTKRLTPVDTGVLRRSWFIDDVVKNGDGYSVRLYNTQEYSSYVEFGHRTRDHKKWIEGVFMMTISEKEIEQQIERIIDRHIQEVMGNL